MCDERCSPRPIDPILDHRGNTRLVGKIGSDKDNTGVGFGRNESQVNVAPTPESESGNRNFVGDRRLLAGAVQGSPAFRISLFETSRRQCLATLLHTRIGGTLELSDSIDDQFSNVVARVVVDHASVDALHHRRGVFWIHFLAVVTQHKSDVL